MTDRAPRKYTTEFALNMMVNSAALLQEEDLGNLTSQPSVGSEPFHIYFIARRPRITFEPDTFVFTDNVVQGAFLVHQGPTVTRVDFKYGNRREAPFRSFRSEWPHSVGHFLGDEGEVEFTTKAAILASRARQDMGSFLDLEVMYVGQSYGDEGDRTAIGRLQSHSKFQSILGEASRLAPDKEIWLILVSLMPIMITSIDGTSVGETLMSDDEDNEHILKVTSQAMDEAQQICFAEAAFIRYFQPKYNKHFRDNFPNPAHASYKACYDLDLNSVFVEFNSEILGCRLYSDAVPARWVHLPQFFLHDPAERAAFIEHLEPKY